MSAPPLSRTAVIDRYFLEHRAKLLDVAAYLDRVERAAGTERDFRQEALLRAIEILRDGKSERARRVLELLSDPTEAPIAQAPMKGALGAYQPPTP